MNHPNQNLCTKLIVDVNIIHNVSNIFNSNSSKKETKSIFLKKLSEVC
jgi:hypothetical protein